MTNIGDSTGETKSAYDQQAKREYHAATAALIKGERVHTVLDLGCGRGAWGQWWKQHGAKILVGLDAHQNQLDCLGREYDYSIITRAQSYNSPESYDVVFSCSMLVHLEPEARREVFRATARNLKEGGVFVFNMPNALYKQPSKYCFFEEPCIIRDELADAGFTVEAERGTIYGPRSRPEVLRFLNPFLTSTAPGLARVVWFKARKKEAKI